MLILQSILYSSFFVGTLKYEILGAALELFQLKFKQFSPNFFKFTKMHEDNPFIKKAERLFFLQWIFVKSLEFQ